MRAFCSAVFLLSMHLKLSELDETRGVGEVCSEPYSLYGEQKLGTRNDEVRQLWKF